MSGTKQNRGQRGASRGTQHGGSPKVNTGRSTPGPSGKQRTHFDRSKELAGGSATGQDRSSICKGGPNSVCNNYVNDDDEGLKCDSCKQWFHIQCQNISEKDYTIMQRLSPELCVWYCHECKTSVSKLLYAVAKVNERCDKLEKEVDDLKTRVSDLEDNDDPDVVVSMVRNECKQVFKEESDKLRRQSNIIIKGLSEPVGTTDIERIDEDKAKVIDICTTELGLSDSEVNIKGVFRLSTNTRPNTGVAQAESETRPRLLKVILGSSEEKAAVLRNAKKLANPTNPAYKVYISPDMTKEERLQNQELVNELKARREESREKNENCHWAIKRKKVVKLPVPGTSA